RVGAEIFCFGELVEGSTAARRRGDEIRRLVRRGMIHCTRLVGALLRIEISVVSRLRVVKVDPQDRGCAANRGRLKRSKYVVDPAPAVAGDVPDGLEIDDTAVRLNDGTF